MAEWQPIETVPKNGDEVLLAHGNSQWIDQWISDVTGDYAEGGYWMMCDQWTEPEVPSHWKPLGPLPSFPSVIDPQSNFDDTVVDDGSWVKPYSEVK